jgi:hypothetical protein
VGSVLTVRIWFVVVLSLLSNHRGGLFRDTVAGRWANGDHRGYRSKVAIQRSVLWRRERVESGHGDAVDGKPWHDNEK